MQSQFADDQLQRDCSRIDEGVDNGEVLVVLWRASHPVQMKPSRITSVEVHDLRIFRMDIVRVRQIDV
jgi:hypothetical protein